MDNHSLYEIAENLTDHLSTLGLHTDGHPSIQGLLPTDDEGEEEKEIDIETLTDKLKSEEAMALIHINFTVNKLAWTDRILRPQTALDPDIIDELDFDRNAFMREQIKLRLEGGEDLDDILADLMEGGDK
jgi:hypothetical protein